MFVNRILFTVLHDATFYSCNSCFQADITIRYGKHWSVLLIWQHSGGQMGTLFRFHDDGVIRSERSMPLSVYACGFLTYLQNMYRLCYAVTKRHIIRFFLRYGIFLHESILPVVIYMHVYKVSLQYSSMYRYDYANCFAW
jgi:hypothetical protein